MSGLGDRTMINPFRATAFSHTCGILPRNASISCFLSEKTLFFTTQLMNHPYLGITICTGNQECSTRLYSIGP